MRSISQEPRSVESIPPATRAQLLTDRRTQIEELRRQTAESDDLREQMLTADPPYRPEFVRRMLEMYQPDPSSRLLIQRPERVIARLNKLELRRGQRAS